MFGIKTKKDKRIEELERELHSLEAQRYYSSLIRFTQTQSGVKSFKAHVVSPIQLSADTVSERLMYEIGKKMKDYIQIDVTEGITNAGCGEKVYRYTGTLTVVTF